MPDERVSSSSTTTSGGSHGFLYFIVGALIVGVAVLAWMFYGGADTSNSVAENSAIERSADAIGDAAEDISDAARSTPTPSPAPAPAPAPTQPAPPTTPAEPGNPG